MYLVIQFYVNVVCMYYEMKTMLNQNNGDKKTFITCNHVIMVDGGI